MIDGGTKRKREHAVRLSQAPQILAQTILDTLREPILVLDVALRVRMVNRSFYQTFRVKPEETESKLIYELGGWPVEHLQASPSPGGGSFRLRDSLYANRYVTKPADQEQYVQALTSVEDFWLTVVKLPQGKTS